MVPEVCGTRVDKVPLKQLERLAVYETYLTMRQAVDSKLLSERCGTVIPRRATDSTGAVKTYADNVVDTTMPDIRAEEDPKDVA